MRGVADLYQEVLLDHARRPRNHRKLSHATAQAEGNNPLCGDGCTVYLEIVDGLIQDIGFESQGCAILLASASMMTLAVGGRTVDQASDTAGRFLKLVTEGSQEVDDLGDLAVLAGVREYPSRVKCATLPWHALRAALRQN